MSMVTRVRGGKFVDFIEARGLHVYHNEAIGKYVAVWPDDSPLGDFYASDWRGNLADVASLVHFAPAVKQA